MSKIWNSFLILTLCRCGVNFFVFRNLLHKLLIVKALAILPSKQNLNLLIWTYLIFSRLVLIFVISFLFDLLRKKAAWELAIARSFECGFNSYFFSRYSFSIHYFLIALIFLFLDLELCLVMPFFLDTLHNFIPLVRVFLFVILLLIGLLEEWRRGQLEWID